MSLGATVAAERSALKPAEDIRVMVVDDSAVVRGLVSRWLREVPGIDVVASHGNGWLAVRDVVKSDPDVVLLDVEMPEMDGLTALPKLLEAKPDLKVIMASTLTARNAEISLRALSLGAADYVPKPETNRGVSTSEEFRRSLCEKVLAIGREARPLTHAPSQRLRAGGLGRDTAERQEGDDGAQVSLRHQTSVAPRVVVIGSSTGGPQALFTVTEAIAGSIDRVPVVIAQHMPPMFTTILADHISKNCGRPCKEAEDGETIKPGHIYIAPGGKHLILEPAGGGARVRLDDGPPVNFCKPAVDPTFHSAVHVFGPTVLGVILTGMGSDGRAGANAIADAGGNVLAQDRETSVVWGMPGSAVAAGACCAVLPLSEIGPRVVRAISGVVR